MPDTIRNNPAAFTMALRTLLQAALALLVAFGAPISPAQRDAILQFTGALIAVGLLVSFVTIKTTVPKAPAAGAPPAALQQSTALAKPAP